VLLEEQIGGSPDFEVADHVIRANLRASPSTGTYRYRDE
jgi:hypothetical protein